MNFNLLDIAIFFILVFFLIRGWMVGFLRGLFYILALVLGFYIATFYYAELLDLLSHLVPQLKFSNIISFAAVFLAVYIVVRIIGSSVLKLLNTNFFGKWDRFMGVLLGIFKGILVVSFLTAVLIKFLPAENSLLKKSRIKPYTVPICRTIVQVVPSKFKEDFLAKTKGPPQKSRKGAKSSQTPQREKQN